MYQKLGFKSGMSDPELANDWIEILTKENLDYTSSLRTLGEAITGNDSDRSMHALIKRQWLTG